MGLNYMQKNKKKLMQLKKHKRDFLTSYLTKLNYKREINQTKKNSKSK